MTKVLFVCVVLLAFLHVDVARACGAFVRSRRPQETEAELAARLPYLTVEQVLLIWDKDTGTEDFIRETRFEKANEAFGFVVPTPTKPEVAAVKKAPFDALRKAYAFEPPRPPSSSRGSGGLGGAAKGSGAGGGEELPPPVVVLSEQRIGSFTAFTLATTDAGAFDKWLSDNGFAMTNEAKPWIAQYIRQEFFFVALRYEPKGTATANNSDAGAATPEMTSETIRIRFKTPHPYYPYMEPALAKDAITPYARMLTGWLVTREPMDAVVYRGRTEYETRRFRRPWSTGLSHRASSDDLAKVVGPELQPILPRTAPEKPLTIQTFRDLKTRRTGYGDVVLVPRSAEKFSDADKEARKFLLTVVDPSLLQEDSSLDASTVQASPSASASPSSASASPSPSPSSSAGAPGGKRSGCSSASSSSSAAASSSGVVLFGVVAIVAARRRRWRWVLLAPLIVIFGGCRPKPNVGDAVDAGVASIPSAPATTTISIKEPTREEKIQMAYAILAGISPEEGIAPDENQRTVIGPKGDAQISAATIEPPISDGERVLAGLRPRFRQCYVTGLTTDPRMTGKLVLTADISPDGSVAKAEATQVTGLSPAVSACCAGVLRRAQFQEPQGGKPSKLKVPITFVQRP